VVEKNIDPQNFNVLEKNVKIKPKQQQQQKKPHQAVG
jgi:hypothetical protein